MCYRSQWFQCCLLLFLFPLVVSVPDPPLPGRMSYGSINGSFGGRSPFGGPTSEGYQPVGKESLLLCFKVNATCCCSRLSRPPRQQGNQSQAITAMQRGGVIKGCSRLFVFSWCVQPNEPPKSTGRLVSALWPLLTSIRFITASRWRWGLRRCVC